MATSVVESTGLHAIAIALVAAADGLGRDAATVLSARGIHAAVVSSAEEALQAMVVAIATETLPGPRELGPLADICRAAAERGARVVLLASSERVTGAAGRDRAISIAHLIDAGAVVANDPESWLEAIVLVATYGVPSGPRMAVVAPPGSYTAHAALALAAELSLLGQRAPLLLDGFPSDAPVDVVLVDSASVKADTPDRVVGALVVPVGPPASPWIHGGKPALAGLRAAIAAVIATGRAGALELDEEPLITFDGAAILPDRERFDRQLGNVGNEIGDHETKVLLSSYGVPVIRQAVATTPSAATRIAKKAGFPVEMKLWGPDMPSEREGCPVERELFTAADVRRAYAALTNMQPERKGRQGVDTGAAMIVRESAEEGREVSARFAHAPDLGWVVVLEASGLAAPVAATLPLTVSSADALAGTLASTRVGEPPPDRNALADILLRVSALLADHPEDFDSIELGRIAISPKGAKSQVIDARARRR